MVIKVKWKKLGFYEYKDIFYGGSMEITSDCNVINIEEKKLINQIDIWAFNNDVVQNNIPFPNSGVLYLKATDVYNAIVFPVIKNTLEFAEKVLSHVERYEKYEGSFEIEILEDGINNTGTTDINGNFSPIYKFIRIL